MDEGSIEICRRDAKRKGKLSAERVWWREEEDFSSSERHHGVTHSAFCSFRHLFFWRSVTDS